jgi:integrase
VTAEVVRLHGAGPTEAAHAAKRAHTALTRFLDRCVLAANTVRAYRRQAAAYRAWLAEHTGEHPDALADAVGAEAAVTAWRRHLLRRKASPATVNQALAAVTLLYEHGPQLRIATKRARVERPSEPDALTPPSRGAVERAADRRGQRDAAIITMLLSTGARVEECAHLEVDDVAITPRTGQVRLLGKGDQVRTVPLPARARAHRGVAARARQPPRPAVAGPARPAVGLRRHPGRTRGRPPGRHSRASAPSAAALLRHPAAAGRRRPSAGPGAARPRQRRNRRTVLRAGARERTAVVEPVFE